MTDTEDDSTPADDVRPPDPDDPHFDDSRSDDSYSDDPRSDADPENDLAALRTTADYQFGAGAGDALFPPDDDLVIRRSSSGRPSQVLADDGRLVTYATDGRFTLGLAGGRRLLAAFPSPAARVVVGDESEPFVRDGKNVFAKFVTEVDDDVRPGDELAVVHERGDLLAVGRAELDADAMRDFDTGMAVKVRDGAEN